MLGETTRSHACYKCLVVCLISRARRADNVCGVGDDALRQERERVNEHLGPLRPRYPREEEDGARHARGVWVRVESLGINAQWHDDGLHILRGMGVCRGAED